MERLFYREERKAHYITLLTFIPIFSIICLAFQTFILSQAMPHIAHILIPAIFILGAILLFIVMCLLIIALKRRKRVRLLISDDSIKIVLNRKQGDKLLKQINLTDIYGILLSAKRKGRISEIALYHNDGKNIDYIGDFKDMEGVITLLKELLANGGRVVERDKAFNRKLKALAVCFYILCFILFIILALNLPREGIGSTFIMLPIGLVIVSFLVEEKVKERKIRRDMERAGERHLQSKGELND